jgi:hypothetical protein
MRFHKGQRVRAPHPDDGRVCNCTVLESVETPAAGETVKLLFDDGVQSDWLETDVLDVNVYD